MIKNFPIALIDSIRPFIKFNENGTFDVETEDLIRYSQILYSAAMESTAGTNEKKRKKRQTITPLLIIEIRYEWERNPALEVWQIAKIFDLSLSVFYSNPALVEIREKICGKKGQKKVGIVYGMER